MAGGRYKAAWERRWPAGVGPQCAVAGDGARRTYGRLWCVVRGKRAARCSGESRADGAEDG